METEKRSHFPFSVSFVHQLYCWARAHKACPLSADLSPCMRACCAKRSHGFDQRTVGISDRSVVRSQMVDADRAESSERSEMLLVASKASFSLRSNASEMLAKWPIDASTLGHP